MEKKILKERILSAIDNRREDIMGIGDSIYNEPELGFKEYKTGEKIRKVFEDLKIEYRDNIAVTGLVGKLSTNNPKYNIAIMSEMDSVVSPDHPKANKETGAAHCCGHNAMVAAMIGVAYAFADTKLLEEIGGSISFMAIPAEEYVELEFRNKLKEEGKIDLFGGKQEFISKGEFDNVDAAMMLHLFSSTERKDGIEAAATQTSNGFIGQRIRYIGKEAHAGGAPHMGVNALSAAVLGINAINAQRETFRDEDTIRVHPIITKGGDLVNTVPSDVRLENYIRGANIEAILDATEKVTRSWKAGAMAIGADVEIETTPGYLPENPDQNLVDLVYENLKLVFEEDKVARQLEHLSVSTDVGDVSSILPTIQARIGGVEGDFHSKSYVLKDKETAYIKSAKTLALTVVDLLYNDGEELKKIKDEFEPIFTKEEYLEEWGKIGDRFK